ncbi:MAG: hypothetical protein JRJ62_17050 [Deltaproteobacteria bacterium]|nr:hypothetical protein [Deltaproteobacteria bacterium]
MRLLNKILPLLIALASFLFAFGDWTGYWDILKGRDAVMNIWDQFTYTRGGEQLFLWNDDARFEKVYNFILDNSRIEEMHYKVNKDGAPVCICRLGGTVRPDIGDEYIDWPDFRFAYHTTPIAFVYDYNKGDFRNKKSLNKRQVILCCTLGNLTDWVQEIKERERFFVYVILIGSLSLLIAIANIFEKDKNDKFKQKDAYGVACHEPNNFEATVGGRCPHPRHINSERSKYKDGDKMSNQIRISNRVAQISKSAIHEMTRLSKQVEDVAFLSWAKPTSGTPEHIGEAAVAAIREGRRHCQIARSHRRKAEKR